MTARVRTRRLDLRPAKVRSRRYLAARPCADDCPGPDRIQDLISGDQVASLLDQHPQHVERPVAEPQRSKHVMLIPPEQHADTPVQTEILE